MLTKFEKRVKSLDFGLQGDVVFIHAADKPLRGRLGVVYITVPNYDIWIWIDNISAWNRIQGNSNSMKFIPLSGVSGQSNPTLFDIKLYAQNNNINNTLAYFTETNNSQDEAQRIFFIDSEYRVFELAAVNSKKGFELFEVKFNKYNETDLIYIKSDGTIYDKGMSQLDIDEISGYTLNFEEFNLGSNVKLDIEFNGTSISIDNIKKIDSATIEVKLNVTKIYENTKLRIKGY